MNLTDIIVNLCSKYQQVFTNIIYIAIGIAFTYVIYKLIMQLIKLNNVKNIITLLTQPPINNTEEEEQTLWNKLRNGTKTNEEKIEIISNNFPIMVQEIKDVYNKRKPKQISAIDLFENNLVIPQNDEILIRNIINSLTSLGLLGTFIGLVASIKNINPEQTTKGISLLLESIGPAITTSILGVIATLLASFGLSYIKSIYKKTAIELEKQMMLDKPSDTNPDYFYDSFTTLTGEKYEKALKQIVDNFIEQMKGALTKDLENYKNAIKNAIDDLTDHEQEFSNVANGLISTVDTIHNYLNKTTELNTEFEKKIETFNTALDNFNNNFTSTNKSTSELLTSIQEINSNNLNTNQTLYNTLESELAEIKDAFKIIKEMNYDFRTEIMNTPLQLNESIQNLCNNINDVTDKFDEKTNMIFDELSNKLAEINISVENTQNNEE